MKRGKDDGKTMKPMFPRLHVNNTEKGWPRAPPRNKMALYEQFSVPFSRVSPGDLPLNAKNTSNSIPDSSSSQGTGTDGNLLLPPHLSTATATNQVRISQAPPSGGAAINPTSVQLEQSTEVGDEDDFMVPVFVQSRMGKNQVQHSDLREKLTSSGSKHSACSLILQTANDKKKVTSSRVRSRTEITNGKTGSDKTRVHSAKCTTNRSRIENVDEFQKEADISTNHVFHDQSNMSLEKLQQSDACLQQHSRFSVQLDEGEFAGDVVDSTRDGEVDDIPSSRGVSHPLEKNGNLNVPVDNIGNSIDRTYNSMQVGNADKSDTVSENSMVDSISGLDICPDDVAGIIGQKRFWKARREIINQQRAFEVQVFELHRLIKVQRLIAASPQLLLEDGVFLNNSSPGSLPAKKLRSAYTMKPRVQPNHSDGPKKSNQNVECSAENVVGKTSLPASIEFHPSTNGPDSANLQTTPVAADNKLSSWHQTPSHHWLVPVMSPTEGLVYKPYPGAGFIYGGCGPYGSIMNPSYGFPGPMHQGIGALQNTPMVGGTYFPTFGMNPAVDQLNWYTRQTNQLSGGVATSNVQHQTSFDISTHRDENHETGSQTQKFQAPKRNEKQVSTASSPADKVQANGTDRMAQSRDELSLFPVAPALVEEGLQPLDSDQSKRVIRVVPHTRTSATESAARIFQSIQNERKQYDSI